MKNAKVILILILALSLMLLVACGGNKCQGKLTGKWEHTDKASKKVYSIEFNGIGKFKTFVDDQEKSGDWSIIECKAGKTAKVKMGDQEVDIKFAGANGIELVYGKVATARIFQSVAKK